MILLSEHLELIQHHNRVYRRFGQFHQTLKYQPMQLHGLDIFYHNQLFES